MNEIKAPEPIQLTDIEVTFLAMAKCVHIVGPGTVNRINDDLHTSDLSTARFYELSHLLAVHQAFAYSIIEYPANRSDSDLVPKLYSTFRKIVGVILPDVQPFGVTMTRVYSGPELGFVNRNNKQYVVLLASFDLANCSPF